VPDEAQQRGAHGGVLRPALGEKPRRRGQGASAVASRDVREDLGRDGAVRGLLEEVGQKPEVLLEGGVDVPVHGRQQQLRAQLLLRDTAEVQVRVVNGFREEVAVASSGESDLRGEPHRRGEVAPTALEEVARARLVALSEPRVALHEPRALQVVEAVGPGDRVRERRSHLGTFVGGQGHSLLEELRESAEEEAAIRGRSHGERPGEREDDA